MSTISGIVAGWRYRKFKIVQRTDGNFYVFDFKSTKSNTDLYDPKYSIGKAKDKYMAADIIDRQSECNRTHTQTLKDVLR